MRRKTLRQRRMDALSARVWRNEAPSVLVPKGVDRRESHLCPCLVIPRLTTPGLQRSGRSTDDLNRNALCIHQSQSCAVWRVHVVPVYEF